MREKSKRLLPLILALVMCLGMLPTGAIAVECIEAIPCKYDEAEAFHEGLAAVKRDGKWGVINTTGKEIAPCKYTNSKAPEFYEGLAAVELDGKWGFIDQTGKEVAPCKYDEVENFCEGFAAVANENYKWGFIDSTGKEVILCKYERAENFSEGLAAVALDGKWGFIDPTGKEVIPCKYESAKNFNQELAAVRLGGKWGFINYTGKEVIPYEYTDFNIPEFHEGLAPVYQNGRYGFIDQTGKEITPCQYELVQIFHEGFAAVENRNYKWGFIDRTGKEVIPCVYDDVRNFQEGFAVVVMDDKYGFIDQNGKAITPLKYDRRIYRIPGFQNGLAAVYMNEKWGFIDRTGNEITSCKYANDFIMEGPEFHEGLAAVKLNDRWGFIDETGKEIIPCKYRGVGNFEEGLAWVIMDCIELGLWNGPSDRYGFIDQTGKEVVPCKYSRVNNFSEGFAAVRDESYKWGYVSANSALAQPVSTIYTATPTNDALKVDGKAQVPTAYKIGNSNYFQLRDVAMLLSGTKAQFSVDYDKERKAVIIITGQPYKPLGTELAGAATDSVEAILGNNDIYINGEKVDFAVYKIGGSNFFQIRALGQALGFNVGWTKADGMFIESDKPYAPNN